MSRRNQTQQSPLAFITLKQQMKGQWKVFVIKSETHIFQGAEVSSESRSFPNLSRTSLRLLTLASATTVSVVWRPLLWTKMLLCLITHSVAFIKSMCVSRCVPLHCVPLLGVKERVVYPLLGLWQTLPISKPPFIFSNCHCGLPVAFPACVHWINICKSWTAAVVIIDTIDEPFCRSLLSQSSPLSNR